MKATDLFLPLSKRTPLYLGLTSLPIGMLDEIMPFYKCIDILNTIQ